MTTNSHQPAASLQTPFTEEEPRASEAALPHFGQDHDLLSERERAQLRLLRWLVRTGRLDASASSFSHACTTGQVWYQRGGSA